MPWKMRSTTACHISSSPARNSRPHATDTSAKMVVPIWICRRGSWRSAAAPEAIEKSRNGTQCEMIAKPARAGEWNFWNMIQ